MVAKGKTLAATTTEALIGYIKKERLQPGDKLPNEAVLGEALQVGRSTLREAIRVLVSQNILEARQGSGTYISQKQGLGPDPLGLALLEDSGKTLTELLALRYLVEPEAAALAARRRSPQQAQAIVNQQQKIAAALKKGQPTQELELTFYRLLAEAGGNRVFGRLLPVIVQGCSDLLRQTGGISPAESVTLREELSAAVVAGEEKIAEESARLLVAYERRMLRTELR